MNNPFDFNSATRNTCFLDDEEQFYIPKIEDDFTPTRTLKNSYRDTKAQHDIISPAKMKERPKFRLIDVCRQNGYKLSLKDFDETKVSIGHGAFGDGNFSTMF